MLRIQPGTAYLASFHLVEKGTMPTLVEVTSLSAPSDRIFPSNTIVLPYGGDAREKIAAYLSIAACCDNKEIYQIEIGVDIDRLHVKALTLDSLKTTALMNIKFLGKCLEATILDYWCAYLEEEGRDIEWIIAHLGRNVQAYISARPDLIGRLIQEKEFQHLNMIVFSLFTQNDSVDVGMILQREAITQKICATDPGIPVLIPSAE